MMASNPLLVPSPDHTVRWPLAELKQHLLLFQESPPGPRTARAVYDLYLSFWGDRFRLYRSTVAGRLLEKWDATARRRFENVELPDLRRHENWGYVFADGKTTGSWLFMFHGYAPYSEAGKASFFRFEFDWQVEPGRLLEFAQLVLQRIRCVSGYGGYVFQGQPLGPLGRSSFDQIHAWARRYWGPEVQNLDLTANEMLHGYKCLSWLTAIGQRLEARDPESVAAAERTAFRSYRQPGGVLLQAGIGPALLDRNRAEPLDGYLELARALEPLQVRTHEAFGGTRWTEAETMAWLRRFTDPSEFA
jgi:hypothetical protein